MVTQIENMTELAEFATALKALGYTTVEQVAGTVEAASDDLARYLNVDAHTLRAKFQLAPSAAALEFVRTRPASRSLGVRLERIQHPRFALMRAPGATANLPPEINLITEMAPVRDQGERGTCVAHAATAVAEHYLRGTGRVVNLSRQFLYWNCKQHDGDPNDEGTWVAVAMARLVADGCCTEATWPYVMNKIVNNESQDPPPPSAAVEAENFLMPRFQQLAATSISDIKVELAEGHCVAFTIPVFNSWYRNDEVTRTGEIVNPIPGEADVSGHAMCFVGYKDVPEDIANGGGKFYLRNSWDSHWATSSVLGSAGYGTIPYSYIAATCREAYSIR